MFKNEFNLAVFYIEIKQHIPRYAICLTSLGSKKEEVNIDVKREDVYKTLNYLMIPIDIIKDIDILLTFGKLTQYSKNFKK